MASRTIRGVTFSGPFFTRDPKRTLADNYKRLMDEIARAGEAEVKARMTGIGTGRTRSRIRGRTKSLAGKPWKVTAVISPDTSGLSAKDAISVMAAASEIESRHHVFRRTTASLKRFRKTVDLSKGMN